MNDSIIQSQWTLKNDERELKRMIRRIISEIFFD